MMTSNLAPQFPAPPIPAKGFNPFNLTDEEVGSGWYLLNEWDEIKPGDGFKHPDYENWLDYNCKPHLFNDLKVHDWPWRRRS